MNHKTFIALLPSIIIVGLLFGGGLILGMLQSLGIIEFKAIKEATFSHYTNLFSSPDFVISLINSLYISATSTILSALLSLGMVLLLKASFLKNKGFHFLLQLPLTVPHLVIAISFIWILSPSGLFSRLLNSIGIISNTGNFPLLVNDPLSVGIIAAYVWKEVPFVTLMLLSVIINKGEELENVGKTLNANWWQRFRLILFPILKPSLLAASLIVFAYSFGAFEVPYLLGQTYPMTLSVWAYRNYSDIDLMARPEGIALGLMIALIISAILATGLIIHNRSRIPQNEK